MPLPFQFTPLREGRQITIKRIIGTPLFQFTPLREGRLSKMDYPEAKLLFQFTPLREGRLSRRSITLYVIHVSIHAPA